MKGQLQGRKTEQAAECIYHLGISKTAWYVATVSQAPLLMCHYPYIAFTSGQALGRGGAVPIITESHSWQGRIKIQYFIPWATPKASSGSHLDVI